MELSDGRIAPDLYPGGNRHQEQRLEYVLEKLDDANELSGGLT